jgi:hypothetical protein
VTCDGKLYCGCTIQYVHSQPWFVLDRLPLRGDLGHGSLHHERSQGAPCQKPFYVGPQPPARTGGMDVHELAHQSAGTGDVGPNGLPLRPKRLGQAPTMLPPSTLLAFFGGGRQGGICCLVLPLGGCKLHVDMSATATEAMPTRRGHPLLDEGVHITGPVTTSGTLCCCFVQVAHAS